MSGTLRLRGATSGYSELQAPAVAADQTFILPTAGGTLLTTDSPISKLTLELGSASQPSLTFEGDTDTGLYSSGTNTLNLVTGGNNRLNIDSSGNIGIGSTDPSGDGWSAANDLVINSTGNSGMTIKSGASSFGQLVFNDAAGGLRGFVAYGHSDDYLGFGTAGAEWMRITSSGRVLIGNTSTSNSGLLCVKGNGNNSAGAGAITIQKGASVSGSNQLIGALSYGEGSANTAEIEVHSDQTWTGSARGSYMTFSTTALNAAGPVERVRITSSGSIQGKAINAYPFEVTDGSVNMGGLYRDSSGANLYIKNNAGQAQAYIKSDGQAVFNGTVNIGGSAAAHTIDEYEEGNWTPTIYGGTTAGTTTHTFQVGTYTRIGRMVHVRGYVQWNAITGSGPLYLGGMPYAISSSSSYGGPAVNYWHNLSQAGNGVSSLWGVGSSFAYFYNMGNTVASAINIQSSGSIIIGGAYYI